MTASALDRDSRVPDTTDAWYRWAHADFGPCGAVVRTATGELARWCVVWAPLTLVDGRWLCPAHAADREGLVWPGVGFRQAVLL